MPQTPSASPEVLSIRFVRNGVVEVFAECLENPKTGDSIRGPKGFLGHYCQCLTDVGADGISQGGLDRLVEGQPVGRTDQESFMSIYSIRKVFTAQFGPTEQVLVKAFGEATWINWPHNRVVFA
jgi:hypothetical protein